MLVCTRCGATKRTEELKFVYEPHGEKHLNYNCRCGGEFIKATKCKVCGEWFDNTELHGVCEECLEEYETVETAMAIGAYSTKKREINGFFADILTTEMINDILGKYVEEHYTDHSTAVKDYLYADKSAYSEYIESLE